MCIRVFLYNGEWRHGRCRVYNSKSQYLHITHSHGSHAKYSGMPLTHSLIANINLLEQLLILRKLIL